MGVRKLDKRHIRNLQKSRGSYTVTLPVDIVRRLGWKERQKVEVREYGKSKVLIKDWTPR